MATRIEPFQVTIPKGTPIATPQVSSLSFNDGEVSKVHIQVPPGPSGLVGFRFLHKGSQVIPYTGSTFIIADDRVIDWTLTDYPTADGWELQAYNIDVWDHTLYLEFEIDEIAVTTVTTTPIVTIL